MVHTPRCKSCAAMEVVRRYRDSQHKDEKPDDPRYLKSVMYADGRFAYVEPYQDEEVGGGGGPDGSDSPDREQQQL